MTSKCKLLLAFRLQTEHILGLLVLIVSETSRYLNFFKLFSYVLRITMRQIVLLHLTRCRFFQINVIAIYKKNIIIDKKEKRYCFNIHFFFCFIIYKILENFAFK